MTKLLKLSLMLILSSILLIAVFSCSVDPVGTKSDFEDQTKVRLNITVKDYDTKEAIPGCSVVLEYNTERIEFVTKDDGSNAYEHLLPEAADADTTIAYKLSFEKDGYLSGVTNTVHNLGSDFRGTIAIYNYEYFLSKKGEGSIVTSNGKQFVFFDEDPNKRITVDIPAGAVTDDIVITLTPIHILSGSASFSTPESNLIASDYILNCEPDGLEFDVPITVTFPMSQGLRASGRGGDVLKLVYLNEDTGVWNEEEAPAIYNDTAQTISGEITHFCYIAPISFSSLLNLDLDADLIVVSTISVVNCDGDSPIDRDARWDDLQLGATFEEGDYNPALLQYFGFQSAFYVAIIEHIHVDMYEWRKFYLTKHLEIVEGDLLDASGTMHHFKIINVMNYQVQSDIILCHDQGGGN